MAPKRLFASKDACETALVDRTAPAAANDGEPFRTREVTAALSLRARVAAPANAPAIRRAAAG